jgi:DNA-binding transcriptional regulator YhcF (GntR family)
MEFELAHVPKYQKVKAMILADIRSGVYRPGERIPTREELVSKYAVTRTTIGQALKILVNAGVLSTSKRGGTVVTGKRMPLKVAFISTLSGAGMTDIVRVGEVENSGIYRYLLESIAEFNIEFLDISKISPGDFGWTKKYDCMVWVMPDDKLLAELVKPEYGGKSLVINRYHANVNFISTNHRQAVREMTEYNLQRSKSDRQVFFLNSSRHDEFIWRERREGFVDACEDADIFYRICDLEVSGYESVQESLMDIEFEPGKDIVMVSPCRAYTGAVLQMAQRRGLKFYENFYYSDFDNQHSLRNTGVKVVSAIQDYESIGRELVKSLRNFGDRKIQVFIPAEIVK